MEPFTNIGALIIDMDGVLWHGEQAVPGLKDFFHLLREKRLPFIVATNNASRTQDQYVAKLQRMGVTVARKEVFTSSMATALYMAERYDPPTTRVFVLGEEGAREPLLEQGFTLTDIYELDDSHNGGSSKGADIVVCGKDETLTWDKLSTATLNLRAGAEFIATNADTTLPTERGLTQGNGAILAALTAATGVTPTIIGKPEPVMYQEALTILSTSAAETIAVGDRLDTDILGAVRTDMRSVLLLSGTDGIEDLTAIDYQPTWIMNDLAALTAALQQ